MLHNILCILAGGFTVFLLALGEATRRDVRRRRRSKPKPEPLRHTCPNCGWMFSLHAESVDDECALCGCPVRVFWLLQRQEVGR